MNDLQSKLFEMLKWFTEYLDDNGYKYYVAYGTFLGVVRHKGFIPWDDDIDIMLPRKDYLRLIWSFDKTIDHYVLENPSENNDYPYPYCKIYDTSTTLVERQRKLLKRGVFIDIFPLDGLGNDFAAAKKYYKKVEKKYHLLLTKTCAIRKERKWYKNLAIIFGRLFLFFNPKKLAKDIDEDASKYDFNTSKYVCCFYGSYGEKEIFEKRVFGEPSIYTFEGTSVKGPQLYDEYLTHLYNNWRVPPKESEKGIQHDFSMLDLKKSYMANGSEERR